MARKADIKPEPLGHISPASKAAARGLREISKPRTPSVTRTSTEDFDATLPSRNIRSGAPSVETRQYPTSHLGDDATTHADTDTDNLLLMEVRPRIKTQPQEDGMPNQSKSFSSTGMAFQLMGQQLKTINDALGRLQTLGIQHVASLPELVLVGDQSSGKSSLMSALANLNLPRSAGICTRCPIHIRVSSSPQWCCNVSLHQDYRFIPGQEFISKKDVTDNDPFPPWRKMPNRIIKEFKTIEIVSDTALVDVEQVIRWAQVAILNDGDHYARYIPAISAESEYQGRAVELRKLLEAEAQTKAKFSPNRVALEIRGPDLQDMSFYDLPGVFHSTPDARDEYLAEVVKKLAADYISHPSAIILWAVPMNTDPDNSATFGLIQSARASNRCVAVLTKADLVPAGGCAQWVKLLSGQSYMTGLGYYVTTRPETDDPDAFEEAYFNRVVNAPNSTLGWPTDFVRFDEKCGVNRLKLVLSQKLGEEFAKSVPQVRRKIESKLRQVEKQLRAHPDLPQNAELEIRQSIADFTTAVREYLGKHAHADWRDIEQGFAHQIHQLKPKFNVKPEESYRVDANGVINLLDTESVGSSAATPMKRRHPGDSPVPEQRAGGSPLATPAAKRRTGPNGELVKAEPQTPSHMRLLQFASPATPGRRPARTLKQVRQIIQSRQSPGKPDLIPEEVYEELCRESIEPWQRPLDQLVVSTTHKLNLELVRILGRTFAKLDKRAIYNQASQHVREFVKDATDALTCRLHDLYRLEARRLFTMNEEGMRHHRDEERRTLDRHRHHYRCLSQFADKERPPLKDWSKMTEEEKMQEAARMAKEAQKLGKDEYEPELHVAAYVRGYYLTAACRFIDTALLHIASGLFPDLAEKVVGYLDDKLGLPTTGEMPNHAVFDTLLAESEADIGKRNNLKLELEKFLEAKSSIESLETTTTNGGLGDTDATLVSASEDDEDDELQIAEDVEIIDA